VNTFDKKTNSDNLYYYCSKHVRFLKSVVFKHILDLFATTGDKTLSIKEIYPYLQTALKVCSANRAQLSALLEGKVIVTRDYIYSLYASSVDNESESIGKSEEKHDANVLNVRVLKDTIDTLGLDFVKAYLSSDGVSIANFCRACLNIGQDYVPVEQVKRVEHSELLLAFINEFSEEELAVVLEDEESCEELYQLFLQDYCKESKTINFIKAYRECVSNINTDNYCINLNYIIPVDAMRTLELAGIKYVRDFLAIDDNHVKLLEENSKSVFAIIRRLQLSLIETLSTNFLAVVTMSKKGGKVNSGWERYVEIMGNRIHGATLEAAGIQYGLTRERVRQIEAKYGRAFNAFYANANGSLTGVLRAFANNEYYITLPEIGNLINNHADMFVYFLKQMDSVEVIYIDELDIFYFPDDIDWYSELLLISTKMPESLSVSDFNAEVDKAWQMFEELGYNLPHDYCEKVLVQDYKKLGTIYSRDRMSLSKRYDVILRKYYPDGMALYDKSETAKFREHYLKTFSDGKLPANDRAMHARIADVGILCGRGRYKPKQDKYISEQLCNDIYNYIMDSPKDIYLTNTLYYVFEDRLVAEGVDNKYYLQGILGESFKGKGLYFKRDYISKTKEATSIYSSVIKYIRNAGRAVSKAEIKEEFPGIPEIVISIACSDENIVVGFASYSHVDTLKQNEDEIEELDAIIQKTVSDGQIHSSEDLLHFLTLMHKNLIDVFEIDNRYKLFSVMKALFADKYELQRPFFAKKGIVIGKQDERIQEFLSDYDELEIDDLMDYIKENDFHYYSVMELIQSLGGFIYKNHEEIIRTEKAGINKYQMPYVEDFLDDILGEEDFIVTTKIKGYGLLPKINIEWNQWVLYGAIRKWSTNYKVMATNNQFRLAIPIIVKSETPVNTLDELIKYERNKLNLDERNMLRYLRDKGLIE
jgi:hypothetical protein